MFWFWNQEFFNRYNYGSLVEITYLTCQRLGEFLRLFLILNYCTFDLIETAHLQNLFRYRKFIGWVDVAVHLSLHFSNCALKFLWVPVYVIGALENVPRDLAVLLQLLNLTLKPLDWLRILRKSVVRNWLDFDIFEAVLFNLLRNLFHFKVVYTG